MLSWAVDKKNLMIMDEKGKVIANVTFLKKITADDICCVSKRACSHCNEVTE